MGTEYFLIVHLLFSPSKIPKKRIPIHFFVFLIIDEEYRASTGLASQRSNN
jgi:hypothetical protein